MKPKKVLKIFNDFGARRVDEFYWMRDKTDPDVMAYIKHENSLSDAWLSDTKRLQEKLFKELKSRKRDKEESVPYFYNGYWYIKKFEKGKEYPMLFRKKGTLRARAENILDQNQLAKGKKYFHIGHASVSPDNRYLAYAKDVKADKRYVLKIKDLKTGRLVSDTISDISDFEWTNDSKTIVYVEIDAVTMRPWRVRRHELGTKTKDAIIFEEPNEINYVGLSKTRSKKFIMIEVGSHDHQFTHYIDAGTATNSPRLFVTPKKGVIYDIDHADDTWYIRTNDRAIDFEIYAVSDKNITRKNWRTFVAAKQGSRYENFIIFRNHFVYEEVRAGIPYFHVIDRASGEMRTIAYKEKVYAGSLLANPEYDMQTVRVSFETMKDPEAECEYDMQTSKLKVLKLHRPRGKFDPKRYVTVREWATARDGTMVPLSIIHAKGVKRDANNPCLLYGYGSYGHTLFPDFNENMFSLIDRGFVFVIAHIRGGQEMGRQWYLDGKFLKKKNTFTDFIDAAEFLIKKKYTRKEKLIARGGSAGGLLMGAVANMRPDLFNGIILQVPFVDVINTMLDPSIPLTTGEYVEWGDPRVKKYFSYMKSYAPYENIVKQKYPKLYVDSGFNDTQVHYWEPLKYVARMKDMNPDNPEVFLHMDMETGHGGKSGRFSYLKDTARIYAVILKMVGIMK